MGKTKIIFLSIILLLLFFTITNKSVATNLHISNWTVKQYTQISYLYDKYPDDFIGIGVHFNEDRHIALQVAKIKAVRDLTLSISARVSSMTKYFLEENLYGTKKNEIQESIKEYSDIKIRGENYEILDSIQFDGKFYVSVLARKNRHKYFDDVEYIAPINTYNNIDIIMYVKNLNKSWKKLASKVEVKWGYFEDSTKKKWVVYDKSLNAKSKVDFEKGYIICDAIIPKSQNNLEKNAKDLINGQIENIAKNEFIKNIIELNKDKKIEKINWDYSSGDKITRAKFTTRVSFVRNYTKKLAEKYLPTIQSVCKKYNLNTALILSIIHTESHFNPYAKSYAGAIGLMQLMPQYGAKDAFHYLYGNKDEISLSFLFNPNNNILLGITYMHILMSREFKTLNSYLKKRHCSIAGYNWGPQRIKNNILNKMPVNMITEYQLYEAIKSVAPMETKQYLDKVTGRIGYYERWIIK